MSTDKDDPKDEQKENPAGQALEKFFAQFGEMDGHKQIVLEEFFRDLLNYEEE